ncbi:hypothetical protein QJS66_01840 [Kocuria rhizophila]|nr:hypothetical protein QJS66_01840 [Kocuria rhizophila]
MGAVTGSRREFPPARRASTVAILATLAHRREPRVPVELERPDERAHTVWRSRCGRRLRGGSRLTRRTACPRASGRRPRARGRTAGSSSPRAPPAAEGC